MSMRMIQKVFGVFGAKGGKGAHAEARRHGEEREMDFKHQTNQRSNHHTSTYGRMPMDAAHDQTIQRSNDPTVKRSNGPTGKRGRRAGACLTAAAGGMMMLLWLLGGQLQSAWADDTASVTFSDAGFSDAEQLTGPYNIPSTGTAVATYTGSSQSASAGPKYYANGTALRFYGHKNGTSGNALIIKPGNGKTITSVSLSVTQAQTIKYTVDGGSAETFPGSGTGTRTLSSITVTNEFKFWNAVSKSTSQLRISSLTITYTSAGGGGTAPSFPTASVTLTATNGVTVTNIQAATGSPAPGYLATCTSGGAAGGTYAVDGSGKFTFTPAASGAYGFRVTATNSAGTNSYTIAVNAKPVIPGVAITGQTADSLSGSVTGIESGATVTLKRYATSADASGNTSGTTVFSEVVNAASKAFTDSGLAGCSTYYYRAWQSHNSQNSDGTVTPVDGTTANVAAPVVTPVQGTTNLTFNWVDVTGATNYVLRVWKDFGGGGGGTVTNTDKFTVDETGATAESSTYYEWGDKTITGNAYYSGNNAGGSKGAPSIQFRSSNGSGIVATNSGGKIRRVSLAWGSTTTGRSLQVYGSHAAYTTATNLHNASTQGTLLGEITNSATAGLTTTNLDIAADWEFVGVRSRSGAMYLASVTFDWETSGGGGGATTNYYGGSSGAAATSGVVVTGLKAQTEYCWSLTANGGTCSASATGTVSTAAGMDQAPSFAENAQVTGDVVVGETYGYTNAASGSPVPGLTASCSNPDAAGLFSVNNSGEFTFAPTLAGTYAFVVTATNQYGGSTHSASYTNTVTVHGGTPTVTAGAATSVTTNSARLPATVNAKGAETTMTFEWGTTDGSSYTGSVAVAGGDVAGHADRVGAAQTARDVYADLGGLIAGTTYFYRWTANNASGTNGTDTGSFTTECFGAGPVVTTNSGSLSATLSWPRMDGADHYLVSMWTGGGTGWAPVGGDTVTPGEYVIANSGTDGAIAGVMSSLDSGGYYTKENAELSDGVLSATVTDSEIWVLAYHTEPGTTNTWWTIQQKGGDYVTLAATSSNSGMGKTNDASVIDAKWNIWMSDGVVTVQSRRATTRYLKYNPTQPRFSSYLSTYAGHHLQLLKAGDPATGAVNGAASGEITDVVVAQPAAGVSPVSAVITSLAANTNAGYSWSVTAVGGGTCSAKTEGSGLKVEAAPAPVMDVSASGTLALGSVNVGGSATATFTVRNTGTAVLYVTNTISGAGFSVSPATFNLAARDGETVAQQTVTVTFAPGSTGAKTGTLTITSNDEKASGTATLNLTGTGTAPSIALECPAGTALASGDTLDFGKCPVWAGAVTQTVTVANSGTGPLTLQAPGVETGQGFSIEPALSSLTVAADGTETFGVKFAPAAGYEGSTKSALVSLTNDAGAVYTFTVTAQVEAPSLTLLPSDALAAKTTPVGTPSDPWELTISGLRLRANTTVTFTTPNAGDDSSVFEMCLTADGAYTSSLTFTNRGTLEATTVYVRSKGTAAVGSYHATVRFASTGASAKTKRLNVTVQALSDGLEFAGQWHMNPGDVWVKTNTTVRDMQFGSGDYYYTPAWSLPAGASYQFKEVWRENGNETWYGSERNLYINGANDWREDTGNGNNNTLVTHLTDAGYYTLRGTKTGSGVKYVAMFTEAAPVEVTSAGDDSATAGTGTVTVRAGLSASLSASEHVYLRYKVGEGAFTLTQMTGSGTNYTATIAGQGKGTRVEWYVLTSPHAYVTTDVDLCTLRGMRSGSTNFCYTTAIAAPVPGTATAGYEQVVLSWALNAAGQNVTIVRYDGTPAAGDITQPADGTAYASGATLVTGTTTGTVVYVNWNSTGVTNAAEQGKTYTYVFYSVNGDGAGIKYSEGASATLTATTMALATPTVSSASTAGTVGLSGANAARGEVYVVARTEGSGTFDGNPSGGLPGTGNPLCGGTVVYQGTTAGFNDSVIGCTTYNYKAWLKAADENAWSAGSAVRSMTAAEPGAVVVTGTTTNTDGFALSWTEADRADGYLISIWTGGETTTNTSATYDVVDKKTVTPGGTVPDGATAVFTNTCPNNNDQITAGKHMMLTLGGYAGKTITGLKLRMHSNAKVGAGTLSVTSGSSTLLSFGDTGFGDSTHWSTGYSSEYTVLDFTSQLTATTIAAGQTLVITITGTTNSLFCEQFEVLYETTVAGTEYVSGYGADGGWVTNGVAIGGMDPGTDYHYSLWAVGATTNCAGPVTTNLVHTDGTAKPNPPGLSLSATDAGTIAATVTRANGEAWELWRFATAELAAAATEPPAAASAGVVRLGGGTTPATGSTTVTDTGLTGCTRYWYRAWEVNDPEGTPLWSNAREANAKTEAPDEPTGLAVTSTNAHGATLAWEAATGAAGYDVEVWHTGMGWGSPKTVTYTFVTNNAAKYTVSGTAPAGSSATFSNHRWVNCVDAGQTNTMTLHGWGGVKITGLSMEMCSWTNAAGEDSGRGSFTMTSGGSTLVNVPDSTFNSTNWYGEWSEATLVTVPMRVTETVVGETANVTLKLIGTEDSLLWEEFTVTYVELEPGGRVYDWENGSGVGGVSVSVVGTNATVTGLTEATGYGWSVASVGGDCEARAEGPDFETTEIVAAPSIGSPLGLWVNGISGTVTGSADADTLWLYRFDDNDHAMSAVLPAAIGGTRVTNVTGGAGTWNFADTNLLGCKTYWYRAWLEDEIDGETYRSPGSTPVSGRTAMAVPEPKGTGAGTQMVISWTNVPGATNYVLQVSDKTNTWTSLGGDSVVFSEEFAGVPTSESSNITATISSYTASNGWVATNAYGSSQGGPKMGASGTAGYLETPTLAGLATNGTAAFVMKSYNNTDETKTVMEVKYGSGEWGGAVTNQLTTEWKSYPLAITTTGTTFKVRVRAASASKQRFFIDRFEVTEKVASAARGMFFDEAATSPTTIEGLEIGSNYFFRVTANGEECSTTGYGWAPTEDAALLEVYPAKKNFGSVNKGQSVSNKFEVSNRGNIALKFAGVDTAPAGCGFAVTWPTGAALRADIDPGSSREYWVTFTPTNSGAYSGTLRFVCNAANGEATEVATNKLVTVPLTGTGYDPESAEPEVIGFSITDALGTDGTVWDQSLALEAESPVLKVTAWHASGIWTSLLPSTNRATWTLRGPDGAVATLADGTALSGQRFTSVRAVPHGEGIDSAEFSAAIPALGAGRAARGPYTLEVTVKDSTGRYATTATNYVPSEAHSTLLDDFTRADVVADGTGKLERGWTAIMSGAATASEAAIRDGALELYGELGTSSGKPGRIAVVRDMSDVGYETTPHEFAGSGSWGFHFRSEAQLHGWNGSSMAGAFVLGSTQPGWLSASDGQAGLAVTLTTNGVQLASFTNSLLANADHPRLTGLGDAWTGNTAGKTLAVRVEFIAGKDAVDEGESDDGQAHDAIPAYLQLYVKEVAGTGGDPTTECDEDDFVTQVEVPEAFTRLDMPYGGVLWAHGEGAAGAENSARFDDIHVPRMSGQSVPLRFWCVDDDTKAPTFDDFDVPAAIAAGTAAAEGLSVTGTILDASGLWMDVGGTNAPAWETAAIAAPSWELWVNGTLEATGATTNAPDGNGAGTEVAVSFTIPAAEFDPEWRTTNCVVVVKAWDHDIDRPGDSKEGRAEYRFTLCDSTPTAPAWATVEADGAEMAVVRWAWTNGTSYVVVRGEEEFGEDATPPQGTLTAPTPGLKYAGLGWVAYVGTGDNHLTNGWTAREVLVPPGSSNYFAVYGMTGDGTTGHFFSSPTRTKAYTWATTNEAGETVTHWATAGDAEGGQPAAGSVWSNSWPMTTVPYEPGEGIDAFAYRTSVSYPTNHIAETPATLALAYGFEARTGTGSGWSTNEPTGWQGDTNAWKIHDGNLLSGKTGYPTPAGNKLYWQDTDSGSKTEAKLTRWLDAPEVGDFFVAAILNYVEPHPETGAESKWIQIALVDAETNDIVSFGKPGWDSYNAAIEYVSGSTTNQLAGYTPYTLNSGHGNDYIVVGQLSRADSKFRMWVYWGATNSTDKIPEVYSKTAAGGGEVAQNVATTALNTVRADWTFGSDTVAEVAGIQLRAGSGNGKELGHVYFDEVRFAATWEELFLFNEPEVETFDLSRPAGSGKENGTNSVGLTQWLVSDGALAHGDVGLNATFELYHRTGIQSASFDILSGGSQGQTNLLRVAGTNTTASTNAAGANVSLRGTPGAVYGEWTTPEGGATGVAIPTNWISLESNYVLQVSLHSTGGREATATSATDNMGGGATDLFFGEYGEGASWDKYVEIYNGTGKDVDLYNYFIVRPANAKSGTNVVNDFSTSYTNLKLHANAPYARLSASPFVLHHKQTVVLLNNVAQPGHSNRLEKMETELDKIRAKYLVMPKEVLDSNGSVPYLLVKAEKFDETAVSNAWKAGNRVTVDWLDACGCADGMGATERYIMSRKTTATHLPRSNPMIIDTNEWDFRRWSFPVGTVDDSTNVPPYTNFVATAGGYDRTIGLGGTMEFRVYDDDEAPPSLAGGGQGGGLRLKGATEYAASTPGDRTYVMGGWSFTYWEKEWVATNLTAAQCEQIAQMWPSGLTTNGGISWSPLLGESITNVVKGGSGKGQTHVEFDGIEQTGYGALTIKADTNKYVSTAEVWIGFDLDVQDLAEPTVSFGYAGGTSGFSNGYVKVSSTGAEGSFEMPNDGWKFTPITGSGTTWSEWSQSLDGVLPEGAGHVWFRVCVKNYKNGSGAFWLDNFRVEGNPRAVRVTDQELADTGVVFEVRVRDESGVDSGAAGTNTSHGATFGAGLGETWYRRAPGTTNIVEGADGAKTTNEYTSIQWTLADGAVEKDGGFGKATAQEWYTKTQDGKGQLKVTVGDLDDDRADDQSVGSKNFGMLVVDDDDDSPPQIRMKTMKPRLDGVVGEWLFKEKSWGATEEMDGVAAGALGVCTTNGTLTKPRASERTAADTGLAFKTYAVYQTGWQAGSKYWTATLRTTGGGKGKVTSIRFWSKVGSVNSPTGWELWTKTGDEDAWEVTAGSDTNGLLKTGGVTNTCWQKQSDEAAEGLAIGVWREYGIELSGDDEIELPADGTPVEIRLLGKGTAPKGIGASWFLWDLTMEGELEQSTGEGEESYTYKTDHEVASGGGESLTMQGSVWDVGSGLAAAPTWEMTQGITGSGTVTFVDEGVAMTNRTSETNGAFSVALPVSTTYTNLQLKEYKGTITATDADNDRNSAEDGSGTNYDSLSHTGKFGFTVVDQDVTKPTVPADVSVNGVPMEEGEPNRLTAKWSNKPEFTVTFGVATDQDPTDHWGTSWTNANVCGDVKKTGIQSGVSGIGEYRVSLTTNTADGVAYSVAVTNGALGNRGFEGADMSPWECNDAGSGVQDKDTLEAADGVRSFYLRQNNATNGYPRLSQTMPVTVSNVDYTLDVDATASVYKRSDGSIVYAQFQFSPTDDFTGTNVWSSPTNSGYRFNTGSGASGDPTTTWLKGRTLAKTLTVPAGAAFMRFSLFVNSGNANVDSVLLSVKNGDGTTGAMRYMASGKAAQGLNAKYLFAVDADDDRLGDALEGAVVPFHTAYDITPPTAVAFTNQETGASTDHVDDPTTQFDLYWYTDGVGPDNPAHANHPTGTGTDVLSPWKTYRVYYRTYDEEFVKTNATSGTAAYIYTNLVNSNGVPQYHDTNFWKHVEAGDPITDPAATALGITNYTGIASMATNTMRLYDLENDEHYLVVVVGVDKAGNEGPATNTSWTVNNTIKFSLIRGWHTNRADAVSTFSNMVTDIETRLSNNTERVSAIQWYAAGSKPVDVVVTNTVTNRVYTNDVVLTNIVRTIVTNVVYKGEVTKDYDLLHWDARTFQERPDNDWKLVGSVHTNWFVDDGGPTRRGDIRFYRASYKDRWRKAVTNIVGDVTNVTTQLPLVSQEVYAQTAVKLRSGHPDGRGQEKGGLNFVALHGVPYTNTFRAVFGGTNEFPGGVGAAQGATCIDFYEPSGSEMRTKRFFLRKDGEWCRDEEPAPEHPEVTDVETNMDFFTQAFSITLPYPIPEQYVAGVETNWHGAEPVPVPYLLWKPILQVPTNGFSHAIVGGSPEQPTYNIVALRLPVATGPDDMNLTGLTGGDPWDADQIYTIDTITREAGQACYRGGDDKWYFVSGGQVPGDYFKPNDVLVIVMKHAGWTWRYNPADFYELPHRHMHAE